MTRKSPSVASRRPRRVRRDPEPVGDRLEDRGTASRRTGTKAVALSLAQRAYEAIKHEIITCVLRPGEYINEAQLCTRLGIGRTPVHQAIGQLQQEQLIDVMPRKGILVRPISLDEYLHLDETRGLLEVAAMRIVAERISRDALQHLESILVKTHAARKARNLRELLLLDRDFHFGLARATQNPVLSDMLCAAYERSLRVWFVSSRNIIIEDNRDDHEQILGALRRRDGEAAARIMREHILSSRSYTMRSA